MLSTRRRLILVAARDRDTPPDDDRGRRVGCHVTRRRPPIVIGHLSPGQDVQLPGQLATLRSAVLSN